MRRLAKFLALDGRRQMLLAEAALALALARVALVVRPFSRVAARLGRSMPLAETRGLAELAGGPPDHVRLAEEVGWAVRLAARHLPFEAVCLPQAMAAKRMLRRRKVPSALSFGVARDEDGAFAAHAWLVAAGVKVTGFPAARTFTEIACFV